MFFLKKLEQYIERKGFRAGTGGADKQAVGAGKQAGAAVALPAAKPAGRVVRRENAFSAEASAKSGCRTESAARKGKDSARAQDLRAAKEALPAAARKRENGRVGCGAASGAEQFAWYYAVRGFFARSAQGKSSMNGNGAQNLSVSGASAQREIFVREAPAPQNIPAREISCGGEYVSAPRGAIGREGQYLSPRSLADLAEGEDTLIFGDEFFADLASLRGLNVEERRRGR